MKSNHFIALSTGLMFLIIAGCKKENNKADAYPSLFKNTVWTGEFHYTSKPSEPVSMEFKEGGQVTWYEWAGDFPGTWKVEKELLTVTFSDGRAFSASITPDHKLSNFQNLAVNGYELDNAALNNEPDVSLDNTVWKGTNVVMQFKPGSLVDVELGGRVDYNNLSYVRKAKFIRFSLLPTYKWFMVNNSIPVMKGVNRFFPDVTVYPFQLNKQ